jgi:hypothetical protein
MLIPFRPEPLPMLRMRYPAAVDHVHESEDILRGKIIAPSGDPIHVFDFEDGFRLAVSREFSSKGTCVVHFSASLSDDCPLIAEVKAGRLRPEEFIVRGEAHYRELSRDRRPIIFLCLSPEKGVPHWMVVEKAKGGGS